MPHPIFGIFDEIIMITTADKKGLKRVETALGEIPVSPEDLSIRSFFPSRRSEGCADTLSLNMNYATVMQEALSRGSTCVLVMEDDVVWNRPSDEEFTKLHRWFARNSDWDMFYFGHAPAGPCWFVSVEAMVVRTTLPLMLHAVAYRKRAIAAIAGLGPRWCAEPSRDIDQEMCCRASLRRLRKFGCARPLASQREGPSTGGIYPLIRRASGLSPYRIDCTFLGIGLILSYLLPLFFLAVLVGRFAL